MKVFVATATEKVQMAYLSDSIKLTQQITGLNTGVFACATDYLLNASDDRRKDNQCATFTLLPKTDVDTEDWWRWSTQVRVDTHTYVDYEFLANPYDILFGKNKMWALYKVGILPERILLYYGKVGTKDDFTIVELSGIRGLQLLSNDEDGKADSTRHIITLFQDSDSTSLKFTSPRGDEDKLQVMCDDHGNFIVERVYQRDELLCDADVALKAKLEPIERTELFSVWQL